MGAFDLLALGVERKDMALKIARAAVNGDPIDPELAEKFRAIDVLFRAEQVRLNELANKPRHHTRY